VRDTGLVRVLVVDDDEAVRSALTHALHRDGYEVSTASDGAAALAELLQLRHDAVVLDVLMPEPGGLDVCREIRARGDDTPILMLTARDLVSDRVAGLDAGADDYLAKPFALEELPAAAIGAAVLARLAAGRVLRPVGRLTETVERIRATGDLSAPIETPGQDEISRLGQAFAAMTAALDESAGAQRRLVTDASHELRTPLTSLITNLELLAERPDDPSVPALAAAALAEAGELRVLINDLVELARDGQASFHIEDVRLDLVAERVAARAAGRAPGLRYELDFRPTLVRGDPDALERAIGNLVDNALKWSPPDGRIRISVAGGRVEVSDDGPGIPADDLPYIFDRFYRSAKARALPGSGLGLAIVRRIADVHHGTVEAIPLPQGVKFRLSVPGPT
jgi:signal transduction histidine kinase